MGCEALTSIFRLGEQNIMSKGGRIINWVLVGVVLILAGQKLWAQAGDQAAAVNTSAVIWEQVDVAGRDLYMGPGGSLRPALDKLTLIGRQSGGNNLKYRVKDANGVEWVVKAADESQAEVAATRLLWAIGYHTEIDHAVQKFSILKVGSFKNVRFEARPEHIKRLDRWSWASNQFLRSREFDGLKIMMALINNWDLKDENTVILEHGGKQHYVVSDLGSSFGKLADKNYSRSGRSVNDAEDYAKDPFVKGVNNGVIEFHYRGINQDLMKGVPVESARWLADLLLQLSDKQIADAFRAANYEPKTIQLYVAAVKARIKALDEAAKSVPSPAA